MDASELYSLEKDPTKRDDLAEENHPVYDELARALRFPTQHHIQQAGVVPWQA